MDVDKSRHFITLVRLGFAARGVTYVLLGILALGTSGKAREGAKGVFDYLQAMPLGIPLLWLIALGLLAYALFRLLSGISNIQNRDGDAMGIGKRIADTVSGISHLFLSYAAYRFANGGHSSSSSGAEMAQPVVDIPLGTALLGIAGFGALIAAAAQARSAITAGFMDTVDARAPRSIKPLGQAGHAARAVVFAIIGWSLVRGAWSESGQQVKGLGEAILALRDTGILYTLVALGLVMFGAFSLVVSRYRIIPDFNRHSVKPGL